MKNSDILIMLYCRQCRLLYETAATWNLTVFHLLLTLKTNDPTSLKNAAVHWTENSTANDTMAALFFISLVNIGTNLFTCNRKWFVTMTYRVIFYLQCVFSNTYRTLYFATWRFNNLILCYILLFNQHFKYYLYNL